MAALNRLPNGYKNKVVESKQNLNKLLESLNKAICSLDNKLSQINNYVSVSNKYHTTDGFYHISFDYGIISSEILLNTKTMKFSLFKTCTVFIDNTEDFVDNYRW